MSLLNDYSPKCPVCRRRATKLVPYCDDGIGEKMCIDCKRKKKKSLPIKKYNPEEHKNE